MAFITSSEIRKKFKGKSSRWVKGYEQGYNNPNQSLEDIDRFMKSGKSYQDLEQSTKEYFDGRSEGVTDKKAGR